MPLIVGPSALMFEFAAEVPPAWDADSVLAFFCAGSPFSSSAPAVTGRDTVAFMLLAVVCSDTVDPGPVVVLQLEEDSTRCLSTVFPALVLQISGETPRFAANPARVHAVTARDSLTLAWLWCLKR